MSFYYRLNRGVISQLIHDWRSRENDWPVWPYRKAAALLWQYVQLMTVNLTQNARFFSHPNQMHGINYFVYIRVDLTLFTRSGNRCFTGGNTAETCKAETVNGYLRRVKKRRQAKSQDMRRTSEWWNTYTARASGVYVRVKVVYVGPGPSPSSFHICI